MYPIARTSSEILSPWEPGLLPMVLYVLAVALALAVILALIYRLGAKSPTPDKQRVYESGVIPSSDAQYDIPVHFYMIAAFFLVFDVEAVFILAWAVAFKQLGVVGWLKISFFIIVLLISLFYVWAKGGLDYGIYARRADKR